VTRVGIHREARIAPAGLDRLDRGLIAGERDDGILRTME
jgi:hypothetical protein